MAGIDSAAVPVHQPPGRALRVSDSVEMQLALLDGAAEAPARPRPWTWLPHRARSRLRAAAVAARHVAASRPARAVPRGRPSGPVPLSRLRDGARRRGRRQVDETGGARQSAQRSSGSAATTSSRGLRPPRPGGQHPRGRARAPRPLDHPATLVVQLVAAGRPVVVLTARRVPACAGRRRRRTPPVRESSPDRRRRQLAALLRARSDADARWPPSPAAHPAWWRRGRRRRAVPGHARRGPAPRHRPTRRGAPAAACSVPARPPSWRPCSAGSRWRSASSGSGILLNPAGYADGDLFGIRAPGGGDHRRCRAGACSSTAAPTSPCRPPPHVAGRAGSDGDGDGAAPD